MPLFSPTQPSQRTIGAATSLIAIASLVGLLYFGRDFFVTLIVSVLFAFILDPAVVLVMKLRLPRPAATAIVIVFAIAVAYILAAAAWTQLSTLADDLPSYSARLGDLWDSANDRLDQFEQHSIEALVPKRLRAPQSQPQQKQPDAKARRRHGVLLTPPAPSTPPAIPEVRIHTDPKPFLTTIFGYVSGYFHVLVMASFVPFLVYFMLSWRDHIGKTFLRLFQSDQRYAVGKAWSGIGESTRAYVLGNFFLWLFLSSLSAIAFFLLGVPYWPLVGPLSAFLSLVPYVGLPLSFLPPVLALLTAPVNLKAVATVIAITATLHLVAMNFLYAKVIGSRVRLNPLAVTVALMFWGVIWGAVGLVLAVPITAAIKAVCDNVEPLQAYGDLLGD
ncbi:MAG: AI-2E family transporter [Acidobacteriaceae bacterium]|nr:AI-2E family transporter [Acidobacteriaceae bacterium]